MQAKNHEEERREDVSASCNTKHCVEKGRAPKVLGRSSLLYQNRGMNLSRVHCTRRCASAMTCGLSASATGFMLIRLRLQFTADCLHRVNRRSPYLCCRVAIGSTRSQSSRALSGRPQCYWCTLMIRMLPPILSNDCNLFSFYADNILAAPQRQTDRGPLTVPD